MKPAYLLLIPLMLSLSSCIPVQKIDWNSSAEIAQAITVEHDEFEKITTYKGPKYEVNPDESFPALRTFLFLRAWKPDSLPVVTYHIYVRACYRSVDWRFYEQAYDSDGKRLDTTVIDRDVVDCSGYRCYYAEHVGININKEYLENHANTGIRFKLAGRAGEEVFIVPPTYIMAFLHVTGT